VFIVKYSLKVDYFQNNPDNAQEIFYTDDKGELFIGNVKHVDIGRTYKVEVSEKRLGTCYRHIITWEDKK
jgi:hypothetical protein